MCLCGGGCCSRCSSSSPFFPLIFFSFLIKKKVLFLLHIPVFLPLFYSCCCSFYSSFHLAAFAPAAAFSFVSWCCWRWFRVYLLLWFAVCFVQRLIYWLSAWFVCPLLFVLSCSRACLLALCTLRARTCVCAGLSACLLIWPNCLSRFQWADCLGFSCY